MLKHMIRTQVYLTKELDQQIELTAKRYRKPKAQVIRELLARGLSTSRRRETIGQGLRRLASVGATGPADLSSRIDDYLYGDEA